MDNLDYYLFKRSEASKQYGMQPKKPASNIKKITTDYSAPDVPVATEPTQSAASLPTTPAQ
jgi:hypothetical protein